MILLSMLLVIGLSLVAEEKQNTAQSNSKTTWQEIVELLNNNREHEAFQLALKHQDENNPQLWCYLGICYKRGVKDVKPDMAKALHFLQKAENTMPFAKFQIGLMYALGNGVERDIDKAWELTSEAVNHGYRLSERENNLLLDKLATPLTEYSDAQLKLHFPGPEFKLSWKQCYVPKQALGYSLRYKLSNGKLDLYVYNKNIKDIPDGVSTLVQNELKEVEMLVQNMQKKGLYQNVRKPSETNLGQLKTTGIHYVWNSFAYDYGELKYQQSITLVFGAFGQFFKLRYTGKDAPPTENAENAKNDNQSLPKEITNFLNKLDAEIAKAKK